MVGKESPPNFAFNIKRISVLLKSSKNQCNVIGKVPLSETILTKKSDNKMVIVSVNPHHAEMLQI